MTHDPDPSQTNPEPEPGDKRGTDAESPAWAAFEARLAASLTALPPASYLIVETRAEAAEASTRYVQFAREERGLLAEAASNLYLRGQAQLGPDQVLVLTELGWDVPKRNSKHKRNWRRQYEVPVPFREVAALAVRTLRDAYSVASPEELVYARFARGGADLPDAGLGLDYRDAQRPGAAGPAAWAPEAIDAAVESVVTSVVDPEHLQRPTSGTWMLATGGQVVRVTRIPSRPPVVRVWAVFMTGVEVSDALLWTVNEVNTELLLGRVLWHDEDLIVAMEVHVDTDLPRLLRAACFEVTALAGQLTRRFVARLPFSPGGEEERGWVH